MYTPPTWYRVHGIETSTAIELQSRDFDLCNIDPSKVQNLFKFQLINGVHKHILYLQTLEMKNQGIPITSTLFLG